MPVTFTRASDELMRVLDDLREQPGLYNQTWCLPEDAEAVCRCVIDRTSELGESFSQALRFLRLAALCSIRTYVEFVYQPALRRDRFESAVRAAKQAGRLPDDLVTVSKGAVRLLEPEMATMSASPGEGFEITFAQMPRLAAFVFVLDNTVGYAAVADVLRPLTTRGRPSSPAREIARLLRNRFNEWLSVRLESQRYREQAKTIQAFLVRERATTPDKINDRLIFEFWRERATDWSQKIRLARSRARMLRLQDNPGEAKVEEQKRLTAARAARDEGFRLYGSTARTMLRFRQALEDALAERKLRETLPLSGNDPDEAEEFWVVEARPTWVSPIAKLDSSGAKVVTWLTNLERRRLSNYLSGGAPGETEEGDGEHISDGALMKGAPYDLRLVRTLLRVDVFGAAQARIISRLKKRQAGSPAVSDVFAQIGEDAYHKLAAEYRDLHDQVRLEALAALHILGTAGEPVAILLVEYLGGDLLKKKLLAIEAPEPQNVIPLRALRDQGEKIDEEGKALSRVGRKLAYVFNGRDARRQSGEDLAALVEQALRARRLVHRHGFRPQDQAEPEMRHALCDGVPELIRLNAELRRLLDRLNHDALLSSATRDRRRFLFVLKRIYRHPEGVPA
jgi:hypothetical protein